MPRPSKTIDTVETADGKLELIQLYAGDWIITLDRRPLMTSRLRSSEVALAEMACQPLTEHAAPRVLIAGLGMGYTLRAALDVLPPAAEVVTAEINESVAGWNRGPLGELTGNPLDDPRVRLEVADVSRLISDAAGAEPAARYDAIVLDLYEGPYPVPKGTEDTVYGTAALERARSALRPGGCLAVWSEGPVAVFEKRLLRCGFRMETHRPKHKGPRHAVYLAWPHRKSGPRGAPRP